MTRKRRSEGRYSKITRRMWTDDKFRKLSPLPSCGQGLWIKLLSGPQTTNVPGLFAARQGGLADELEWSLEDFRRCWKEINDLRLAFADWKAGLVWVPNALRHNEPESPNVVAAWEPTLLDLPECDLKDRAIEALEAYCLSKGEPWAEAWGKASRKLTRKPYPKAIDKGRGHPCGNQEQEQEQDQDPPVTPPLVSGVVRVESEPSFGELCRRIEANPNDEAASFAHERPEVTEVHSAYCRSTGLSERRLGAFKRDAGVRAICALYALDYSRAELIELVRYASKDPWLMGIDRGMTGLPKDVSALTPPKAGSLRELAREEEQKRLRIEGRRKRKGEEERRIKQIEAERMKEPRPSAGELDAMLLTVVSTGFLPSMLPSSRPGPLSVVGRPVTAEEIERALEGQRVALGG